MVDSRVQIVVRAMLGAGLADATPNSEEAWEEVAGEILSAQDADRSEPTGLVLDVDLVDRVAEAMTGFLLDSTVEEDAEAWRATARAAIDVIRTATTDPAAATIMRLVVTLRSVEARCDKAEALFRESPAKPEAHFATLLTMVRHVIREGLDG